MPGMNTEEILRTKPRGTLDENEACLSAVFHLPENKDLVIRRFVSCGFEVMILYVEGLSDGERISECILQPCISKEWPKDIPEKEKRIEFLKNGGLFASQTSDAETMEDIVRGLVFGLCTVFAEGDTNALFVDVRKFPARPVNRTNNESVVMGSQEGFVESLRTNISLIRKNVRTPDLISDIFEIGGKTKMNCAILYIDKVADDKSVKEAKRRLRSISGEGFIASGQVQQLIEDHPYSLFPQILQTERPDRASAGLIEGQFAILTDNSPYALMAPSTIFHFLHASDDTFMRWQYGTMLRIVRMIGVILSVFLPGIYIALTQYHSHLLPMNLMTSIAEARADVPFSVLGELLIMEFAFNLINEAGTRIPSQIGSALGIVGALILGQAAVSASIASPILIIIVAITGLGNFVVPSYSMSLGMQIYRLMILLSGAAFGLYGIVIAAIALLAGICSMRSFGSPYVSPVAPKRNRNADIVLRLPLWLQKSRMFYSGKAGFNKA